VPLSRTVAPYADHNHHNHRRAADGTGDTDTFIPVTNPLERLNKEIKRRTDVVGVFPNPDALRSSKPTTNGKSATAATSPKDQWPYSPQRSPPTRRW